MIVKPAKILHCPFCGSVKYVAHHLSISHRALWSDGRVVPTAITDYTSRVQWCSHCDKYWWIRDDKEFLVPKNEMPRDADEGHLRWHEFERAYNKMRDDGIELTADDKRIFWYHALWAFNDFFYRKKISKLTSMDEKYKSHIIQALLNYEHSSIKRAELYRELGDMQHARQCIQDINPLEIKSCKGIFRQLNEYINNNDAVVFLVNNE